MEYTPVSEGVTAAKPPRLLDQVWQHIRVRHYSLRTEQAYVGWIRRFVLANGKRHPRELGATEVGAFLTRLATVEHVSASTQNQALSALLFLYRVVLDIELPRLDQMVRAKLPRRLPVVLSQEEVARLLRAIPEGQTAMMAQLLYGTGMRLMECVRLRIKDVDFGRNEICVRSGKGNKDRRLPLQASQSLQPAIPCVTRLRRICWKPVMTSALCRSSLGTRMSLPRRSTRMCWGGAQAACSVPWTGYRECYHSRCDQRDQPSSSALSRTAPLSALVASRA